MTSAAQFNHMKAAAEGMPWWYWNRCVLTSLRSSITRLFRNSSVKHGAQVVEFGCGNRPYEQIVLDMGASYRGGDYPDNKHADLHIDGSGRLDCPDCSFDCVLSAQVLEHVPDPRAYLQEIRRILKPGGDLLLSTHGVWEFHPCPTDYWRWTFSGLEKILSESGYQIDEAEGVVGMFAGSIQLLQDSVRRRLPWGVRQLFVWMCQSIMGAVDRLQSSDSKMKNAMIFVVRAHSVAVEASDTAA